MTNFVDENNVFGADNTKQEIQDKEHEEGYVIIGGVSECFDAKGYPKDALINVVRKIRLPHFLITVQRRKR